MEAATTCISVECYYNDNKKGSKYLKLEKFMRQFCLNFS